MASNICWNLKQKKSHRRTTNPSSRWLASRSVQFRALRLSDYVQFVQFSSVSLVHELFRPYYALSSAGVLIIASLARLMRLMLWWPCSGAFPAWIVGGSWSFARVIWAHRDKLTELSRDHLIWPRSRSALKVADVNKISWFLSDKQHDGAVVFRETQIRCATAPRYGSFALCVLRYSITSGVRCCCHLWAGI